jgi:hypothetical protein
VVAGATITDRPGAATTKVQDEKFNSEVLRADKESALFSLHIDAVFNLTIDIDPLLICGFEQRHLARILPKRFNNYDSTSDTDCFSAKARVLLSLFCSDGNASEYYEW